MCASSRGQVESHDQSSLLTLLTQVPHKNDSVASRRYFAGPNCVCRDENSDSRSSCYPALCTRPVVLIVENERVCFASGVTAYDSRNFESRRDDERTEIVLVSMPPSESVSVAEAHMMFPPRCQLQPSTSLPVRPPLYTTRSSLILPALRVRGAREAAGAGWRPEVSQDSIIERNHQL